MANGILHYTPNAAKTVGATIGVIGFIGGIGFALSYNSYLLSPN